MRRSYGLEGRGERYPTAMGLTMNDLEFSAKCIFIAPLRSANIGRSGLTISSSSGIFAEQFS